MRRRDFVIRVGGAMAVWPMFAQAQAPGPKRWRIGCVLPLGAERAKPLATALEQRLVELGYENGRNINLVTRIVSPQPEIVEWAITTLLPDIDILVIGSTIGGMAAKKVAPEMPTVFFSVGRRSTSD
jgi:hypothetical protein